MTRSRIFVTRRIPDVGLKLLAQHGEVEVWPDNRPPERAVLLEKVRECSGILSLLSDRIDEELLVAAGPQLKVVSNFAVGFNNIDLNAAARHGVRVGNTPDVLTDATADMAMCLLLAAARFLKPAIDNVRDGKWFTWEPLGFLGCELRNRTVGIVGAGRIGAAFAQRCHGGWGMEVLYTSRSPKAELEHQTGARRVSFEDLLRNSDFLSIHCDLNDQTRHLINADALSQVKQGAILVNTSRGPVVDQDALVVALQNGRLAAAGLDVTEPEPLSPEHPLVALPNCVIAPHIGSATHEARDAMSRIAAENILAVLEGREMPAEVRMLG